MPNLSTLNSQLSTHPETWLIDLGLVPYDQAVDLQLAALSARAEGRVPDLLLLLEHPPVITLGRGADPANVLATPAELARRGIEIREAGRGGDVTLHAPGQLVGYPIVDLRARGRDVHRYLRDLEEVLIRTVAGWGMASARVPSATGVWVGNDKVAAIGVGVKQWVTYHGFALNVATDLSLFETIIPCGLVGKGVTSLTQLLGREVRVEEAASRVAAEWPAVFATRLMAVSPQQGAAAIGFANSVASTFSRKTGTMEGSHWDPAPPSSTRAACSGESAAR
jgi:lipoate-protein ligase B